MSSSIYSVTARFSFPFQKNGGGRAKILLNSDRSICSEKAWYICCSSISNIPPILGTDLMFKRALIVAAGHTSDTSPTAWKPPNQVGAGVRIRNSEYGGRTGRAYAEGSERGQERGQPLRLCRPSSKNDHEGESRIPQSFSP